MININGIDHLNITVSNLDKSLNFYKNLFGFKTYQKEMYNNTTPFALIGLPNKLFLCLYQGEKRAMGHINHIGINVFEFEKTIQALKRLNIEIKYGGEVTYPRSRSLYIADPDGNEIELSERFGGDVHRSA